MLTLMSEDLDKLKVESLGRTANQINTYSGYVRSRYHCGHLVLISRFHLSRGGETHMYTKIVEPFVRMGKHDLI
jgi:hypothetical protein